jgi:hypothetical protein
MTWFRRTPKPTPPPAVGPRSRAVPTWSADVSWWSDPVVRLGFVDDTVVDLRADDPRTRAFVALADALVGSSRSPIRPI